MSEQERDNKGCLGVILMIVGFFGILMWLFSGQEYLEYLGILIPIGYLTYTI